MSVMVQEAPVAKATSPDYFTEMRAETKRVQHALRAFNHGHVTKLNGTSRRVAEAIIMAFAFPAYHGPHYDGYSRTSIAIQHAELMIPSSDRSREEACRRGVNAARSAFKATYEGSRR